MKLEDVGERKLLEMARDICGEGSPVLVGVGDDAAAVKIEDESLVATTDMLVEEVHFTLEIPTEHIGRKATVVNLSDLAAMGAEPLGLVYSIGAPGDTDVEFISTLLSEMDSSAREYGAYLVGGDLNESEKVVISGTALGSANEEDLLLRSGAEAGDIIGVTGELGAATAATWTLCNDVSLEEKEPLREVLFEPEARVEEGRVLSENGRVTSAVDVTDGLAANLWQISRMSEVGLVVDSEKLPVNEVTREFAEDQNVDLDDFVLYGGEDFELLFTVHPEAWEDLEKKFSDLDTRISKIGEVKENPGVQIRREGELEELPDRGYEHFRD